MMRRTVMQVALFALLIGGVTTGCTKPAVREKQVPDPLLTSKKPIEGRVVADDAAPLSEELLPPPPPPSVDFPLGRSANGAIVNMQRARPQE